MAHTLIRRRKAFFQENSHKEPKAHDLDIIIAVRIHNGFSAGMAHALIRRRYEAGDMKKRDYITSRSLPQPVGSTTSGKVVENHREQVSEYLET